MATFTININENIPPVNIDSQITTTTVSYRL